PTNNVPENLEALTPQEHHKRHWDQDQARRAREHINSVRHLAAAWHSSPAGRAWHRKHAKECGCGKIEGVEAKCGRCGKSFIDKSPQRCARYCSNACRSAARRASRVDDEVRTCVICGTQFKVNRYSKTRACGKSCANVSQSRTKRGIQPHD